MNVNLTNAKITLRHHLISRAYFLDPGRKRHPLQIAALLWIGVPTLLAMFYYFIWASPMYESSAELTVRNMQGPAGGGFLDSMLGKTFGGGNNQDAQIVKEFLESRQAVAGLEQSVNLRHIYADPSRDFISRLGAKVTNERLFKYFLGVSNVEYDADTGVVIVKVRAFTAAQAHAVAEAMIALADDLVQHMAAHAREDAIAFSKQDLELAEARLQDITASVTSFRNSGQDINPAESTKAGLNIVAALEQEIVKTRASLAEATSYFQPDAIAISTLKARLAALEGQLRNEQRKLTGDGATFSKTLPTYEGLSLDLELARRAYASALAALDTARKEAVQRDVYLVPFVKPDVPDEATYPRALLSVLTVFVAAATSFGIITLVIASIREHLSL